MSERELRLTECLEPGCDMPAEIIREWTVQSTDGPVEMMSTRCLDRHILTPVKGQQAPDEDTIGPYSYALVGKGIWAVLDEKGSTVAKFVRGKHRDARGCARRSARFLNQTYRDKGYRK